MLDIHPRDAIMLIFVLIVGAPAALDRLGRIGALPKRISDWWLDSARRSVESHQRDEALTQIAPLVPEILRMVKPNSGESLYDIAKQGQEIARRTEQKLDAHITKCENDHDTMYGNMETLITNDQVVFKRISELDAKVASVEHLRPAS